MLDDHDQARPVPPAIAYKYVSHGRIDVLRNAQIRFTPPSNTNDIFEVRQSFEMLAGPKMQALFAEQATLLDVNAAIADTIKSTPLAGMSPAALKRLFKTATGGDLEDNLQGILGAMLNRAVFPAMNSPQAIDALLMKLANDLVCLSLTERSDCSPMWAHYAGNSTGFVIAFDTSNEFFRRGDGGERQGLYKITYFNGKIAELMDDVYAALMSKQEDWAYEREWRLYLKADQATETLTAEQGTIHLVDFPKLAVQRVILGLRASDELELSLRNILASDYPHAHLTRIGADRTSASLTETLIS